MISGTLTPESGGRSILRSEDRRDLAHARRIDAPDLHLTRIPMEDEAPPVIGERGKGRDEDLPLVKSRQGKVRQHGGAILLDHELAHLKHGAALEARPEIHPGPDHGIADGLVELAPVATGSEW